MTGTASSAAARRADLGFAWALKRSFVEYVAGMRDGRMSLEGDAALTSTREFYFPYLSSVGTPGGNLVVRFNGGIVFTAHHGLLSVAIRNPSVRVEGTRGTITIDSSDGAVVLAELEEISLRHDGDVAMFSSTRVTLASPSVELFGSTYPASEPLAPLTFRVPRSPHIAPVD